VLVDLVIPGIAVIGGESLIGDEQCERWPGGQQPTDRGRLGGGDVGGHGRHQAEEESEPRHSLLSPADLTMPLGATGIITYAAPDLAKHLHTDPTTSPAPQLKPTGGAIETQVCMRCT